MQRLLLAAILMLLMSGCGSPRDRVISAVSPNPLIKIPLEPSELFFAGETVNYQYPLFITSGQCGYIFDCKAFNMVGVEISPAYPAWLGKSNWEENHWTWEEDPGAIEYIFTDLERGKRNTPEIALWSETPNKFQVNAIIAPPRNYLYAEIAPIEGTKFWTGEPFIITFYGVDLHGGGDIYTFFGIDGPQGAETPYLKLHNDYRGNFYDIGTRSSYDIHDPLNDTLYGTTWNPANSYGLVDPIIKQMIVLPWVEESTCLDFFRGKVRFKKPAIGYAAACLGIDYSAHLNGESGAICNLILKINDPGEYTLWFKNDPTFMESCHLDDGYEVTQLFCANPVTFTVVGDPVIDPPDPGPGGGGPGGGL